MMQFSTVFEEPPQDLTNWISLAVVKYVADRLPNASKQKQILEKVCRAQ